MLQARHLLRVLPAGARAPASRAFGSRGPARPLCANASASASVQVVTPRSGNGASCPFCKRSNYSAEYTGPLSVQEQQRIQQEEQKAIELQIEQQVREEKAYRERLASRGVVASPEGSLSNSASTLPTPIASPQLLASPGGMTASPNATSIPVLIPSASGSESGGTYPSCSASPTTDHGSFGPSPAGLQPSPPRLVAPIVVAGSTQGDDGYDVRWLEAQQAQHRQALDGSHTASPPTAPNFAELREHWSPAALPEPVDRSFEAELEDLMLMEAIRLSMLDQQQPAASDAAATEPPQAADSLPDPEAAVGGESDARRGLGASLSAAADVAVTSGDALGDPPLAPREAWSESPEVADSGEPAAEAQPPDESGGTAMPGAPDAGDLPASGTTVPAPAPQADEESDGSDGSDGTPPPSSSPGAYESDLQLALALSLSMRAASPAAASPTSTPPVDAPATAGPAAVPAADPAPTEPIVDTTLPRPVAAAAMPADD